MNSQVCGCPILGLDRRRFRGLIGVLSRTDSSVVALAGAAVKRRTLRWDIFFIVLHHAKKGVTETASTPRLHHTWERPMVRGTFELAYLSFCNMGLT